MIRLKNSTATEKLMQAFVISLLLNNTAFAALTAGQNTLEQVRMWLWGISGVSITIAIMYVGFRMIFQAAQWKDVAPVFWGGILIGSASSISTLFV